MKKAAILQSNYIPWKGYFDLIASVDVFVIYDDMQYTKRDWRNRNKIKTQNGLAWLTIPVEVKGKYFQKVNEVSVSDSTWTQSHLGKLKHNYKESDFFDEMMFWLEPIYSNLAEDNLTSINTLFIKEICKKLGIETKIVDSREYELAEGKTERLVDLCQQLDATHYISGPAAKGYIQPELFEQVGIGLQWANYDDYQIYPQLWGEFEHAVTILDLFFNVGDNAREYMKYVK